MSIELMNLVWAAALPMSRKSVLLALADQANDDALCWPSIETIAWKMGCSERLVQKAIADLIKAGLVRRDTRPGHSNIFFLDEEALLAIRRERPKRKNAGHPSKRGEQRAPLATKEVRDTKKRGEQGSPHAQKGVNDMQQGVHDVRGRGEQRAPITINEPTKEPKHTRSPSAEPDPAIAEVCSKLKIIDPGRLMEAEAMVEAWLGQGVPKAKLITLAAQASVKRHPLGYLKSLVDPVLAEVVAKREKQARAAADTAEENWPLRLEMYDMTGQWNAHAWGPMPGIKGCRVPPELLARHRAERQTGNSAA